MLFYFSYLKFGLLLRNIELTFITGHVFVVNDNSRKRTRASMVRGFF